MTKTPLPTNFVKHTSKNPIQKLLIKNFYSSLISLAKPLKAESILDTGCGEGFTINLLIKNGIGEKIEGIEFSKEAISLGKKLFPKAKIEQGSIYSLPYKSNSFDLVLCNEVLEHLENPQKAMSEIFRVTKSFLIISIPNEPFFMISNFLRGKNILRFGNDSGHVNHWNFISFKKYLRKNSLFFL